MRPRIFLSSVFADPEGTRLPIRDEILRLTGGPELPPGQRAILVAEDFQQLKPRDTTLSELEKALFCVAGVRECDVFLAILSHRAGSEIPVAGIGHVPTSFFELELMAAALFRKPAFIYLHQGFERSEKLDRFLEMIRPAFPDASLQALSSTEIVRRVEPLVKQVQSPIRRHFPLRVPRKRLFVNELFRTRHAPYRVREEGPPIRFLDERFDTTVDPSRAAEVPRLLERAKEETNYEHRLVMLWFGIHALMGVPYTNPMWSDYISLWDEALGSWNSAGAWYGLHGHAAMAGVAALGSLAAARTTVASPTDPRHGIPHGPLASAYYSIAKQAANRAIYDLALEHVDVALALKPPDETNLRAIRASVLARLGHRGAAIEEYIAVAEARRDLRAGLFGEALSELGYALVMSGRRNEGLVAMERGVELLLRDPRPGFDVRAIRKLAIGYALCAEPVHAFNYAVMAYDKAVERDAHDQITKVERLAKQLDRLVSRRASRRASR